MSDAMKEALKARRMKGLDVDLIMSEDGKLTEPKLDAEDGHESDAVKDLKNQGSDLAPDKHMLHEKGDEDGEERGKVVGPSHREEDKDGEMSYNEEHAEEDADKQDAMSASDFHKMMMDEHGRGAPNTLRDKVRGVASALTGDEDKEPAVVSGKEMGKKPMGKMISKKTMGY